jgi:hypothetical protein
MNLSDDHKLEVIRKKLETASKNVELISIAALYEIRSLLKPHNDLKMLFQIIYFLLKGTVSTSYISWNDVIKDMIKPNYLSSFRDYDVHNIQDHHVELIKQMLENNNHLESVRTKYSCHVFLDWIQAVIAYHDMELECSATYFFK